MLNLSFIYDDATHALTKYAERLDVSPLPATVYMMQMDVINHYRYALDHYFTLTLSEPFLQDSSIGTPYQKWSHFNNENFGLLSFTIRNLLRYTSRLIHETECIALEEVRRFSERASKSNSYTDPICELRFQDKSIGLTFHEDNHLSIIAIRAEPMTEKVMQRSIHDQPPEYLLVTTDEAGTEHEEPIDKEEFQRLTETI